MKKIIVAVAFGATALSSAAYAESNEHGCTQKPRSDWQSMDALKAKGAGMGLDVRGVKIEGTCYEAYAMDKAGKKMELVFDPVTLEQVGSENGEDAN